MLIPVEALIDGVVRTLTESVLPAVETRVARTHLYAAVDVLRNLRDRVERRSDLCADDAAAAETALARVAGSLPLPEATRVTELVSAAPSGPPCARADALRAAITATLEILDALSPAVTEPARAAIGEYLATQTLRDLMVLKPSMLAEISKG